MISFGPLDHVLTKLLQQASSPLSSFSLGRSYPPSPHSFISFSLHQNTHPKSSPKFSLGSFPFQDFSKVKIPLLFLIFFSSFSSSILHLLLIKNPNPFSFLSWIGDLFLSPTQRTKIKFILSSLFISFSKSS